MTKESQDIMGCWRTWLVNCASNQNSQGFQETEGDGNDEEVKTSSSPEVSVTQGSTLTASLEEKERLDQTPGSASMNQPAGGVHVIDGDGGSVPLAEARKRLLPAWMTASTSDVKSPDTPKAVKRAPATKTPKQTHRATPKRVLSPPSPEDAELEEVVPTPKKRMRRIKSDEESPPQVSAVILAKAVVSDESDSMETGGEEAGGEKDSGRTVASSSKKAAKQPKQAPPPNGRRGQAEPAGVPRRTACPYGSSCYRKNPLHFKECSHPGDSDFEEEAAEDEEEDDDRPECPYGTDCYRKNPLHKKEYKHTKPPVRTSPSNDDGEEFDDDDSFINDDSEEVEEDSDYVPNYSDDGGKEDVKRLQKEAKAFLRRKK
ncbi:aprataxin and PNK-like factor isoform X2 [Denticeps clupeoides]|uniref:aprataxin and PNK-like factor isoform X2 n=1 Tax=Denticeps clupeoides TaxID=299321 RepID=UPI0010A37E25|nr:aprataxin and PNK-like factor isoform X2 [Denticeps clupeoides]